MRKFILGLLALSVSVSSAANDTAPNIFHADLSNADLSLAVRAFEQVCMPFILHKTELTQDNDIAHHTELLKVQGYEFQRHETRSERFLLEPLREEWKPVSQAINPGQFTLFNGGKEVVVPSTKTIVRPVGEISGPVIIPPIYKTITNQVYLYKSDSDKRLTVALHWGHESVNRPGFHCNIKLEQPAMTQQDFKAQFLDKDADWRIQRKGHWNQCVNADDGQFRFGVSYDPKALRMDVIRDSFDNETICR